MGELYRSLTRNANLIPTAMNIGKFLDEKRKQENLAQFLKMLQGTRRDVENVYDEGIVRGKNQLSTETWQSPVKTSDLIGPKTQQEAMKPPEIAMDEGVEVDVLGDYSSSPNQINEANRKANRKLADYLYGTIGLEGVEPEKIQAGANILSQIIRGEQQPERTGAQIDPNKPSGYWENGQFIETRPADKNLPMLDDSTTRQFKTNEKGEILVWDDAQKKWLNTGEKEKDKDSDSSLGWAKLFYEQEQDRQKKAQEEKENQARYNDVMSSDWVPMDELLAQGLIDKKDPSAKFNPKTKEYKQGGAYVVRDKKGDYKLIFDDKQLEDYAKSQVTEAPKKWSRDKTQSGDTEKKETKGSSDIPKIKSVEDYNKLPSGTIYIDPNGNKRKKS